jgi:hypothetical protein
MSIATSPAQLIIGPNEQLRAHAEQLMQQQFCPTLKANPSDIGCFCGECRKIKNRQHPSIVWIYPEKDYTVDDIEIIFERTRFSLDPDQHFFIILENAHTLTTTTANRLLKVVEEPPAGYHFIFLTTNREAMLPTILSRCVVVALQDEGAGTIGRDNHPLLQYFYRPELRNDPIGFEQELKKQKLSDTQSIELIDGMVTRFAQQLKDCYRNGCDEPTYQRLEAMVERLTTAQRTPPQSGSSDIFWKWLFLTLPR